MDAKIIGYRGIGNQERIIISGHAFKSIRYTSLALHHKPIHNLRQTVRRFRLHPMKRTKVEVRVAGQIKKCARIRGDFLL